MLKQNPNESDEPPAAQIRVKREEFARAISALEARRQAEAQFLEGTVAVEDTLRELQVDVSTEEVMQQIEAQRAGYVVEEKPRRVWDHDKITDFKLIGGIVLVPLFVILWCAMLYHPSAMPNVAAQTGSRPEALAWMPPPPMMSPGIVERQMDEGGFNASSVLKPLSQVADNEQVHCNSRSLGTLFNSDTRPLGTLDPTVLAGSNQVFDVRPTLRKPWILIKHEGRLYLRAWVAAKFTADQAEGRLILLHSSPKSFDPGVHPVPITLPISFHANFRPFGSFQFGLSAAPSLSVGQVSLDQHAWEKW